MPPAPHSSDPSGPSRRGASVPAPVAWQRVNRLLILLITLTLSIGLVSRFLPEFRRYHRLESHVRALETRERELRDHLESLRTEYRWMMTDPDYAGLVARDMLDLAAEGEVIYRYFPARDAPR